MTESVKQRESTIGSSREETVAGLRPVFVVGGLYSLANGVAWIMRDLAAAMGKLGSPVTVCAADCWGRGAKSVGHVFEAPSKWVSSRGLWLGGLSWSPALKRQMRQAVARADVVHNHSVWMLPNSYGSRIAARHSKPVVITAHGALEPWAISTSQWKKRIVGRWFQDQDLKTAACIHVNSHAEIDGIREYGLTCPVAVIPNGINPPEVDDVPEHESFRRLFPEIGDQRIALFMARLHEKKGLGHLIPAWAAVAREFPDWHLVLAGPDDGYERSARELVSNHGVSSRVTFTGGLQGMRKTAALAAADVFVQPSFSEGFSMSILEALGAHLPVLMTPGCNFPDAVTAEAAVLVEPNVEGTVDGLRQLLSLSNQDRCDMGRRGRTLVVDRYSWDNVARKTLRLYHWLCNGGSQPEFVVA